LRDRPAEHRHLDEGDGEKHRRAAVGIYRVAAEAGEEVHAAQAKKSGATSSTAVLVPWAGLFC
jgi:hypothetical protein